MDWCYTYKLRDDAYFHNGRKMTADDIIWSFTRIMDGSKGYPGARYVRLIKGATRGREGPGQGDLRPEEDRRLHARDDDHRHRVEPGYYFFDGTTAILPKEEVEKGNFANNPVGLGPFKFKEHVPGSRVVVERWEKFYKPGKPYADRIVFVIMAEAAARDVAFRNKEIDTSILGPAQYVAYRADPELSKGILEVAEMFTRSMRMNPAFKPFADKRVRQAINHAIDTDLIIKRLVKDKAYRAVSWLPLSSPAFDKTVKPYAFDPDKAKKLLAEAGYPDGFEFELTTSQNESWGLPIVEAMIPYLAKVGIKVKPKLVEVTVLTDILIKGEFQAIISSSLTGPDSLAQLRCFYSKTPRTACNYCRLQQSDVRQAARRGRPRRATRPSTSTCCARPTTCSTKRRRCGSSTTTRRCWPISRGCTVCRPTRPRSHTSTSRTSGSTSDRRRSDRADAPRVPLPLGGEAR